MLTEQMCPHMTEFDQRVYRIVVPQNHFLVNAMQVIPWDEFNEPLAQLPQQLWRVPANRWVFAFSFPLHLV